MVTILYLTCDPTLRCKIGSQMHVHKDALMRINANMIDFLEYNNNALREEVCASS